MLLAALQIRHFIYFARAFIISARAFTGSSRELGSRPRGGFLPEPYSGMSMRLKKVCPQCDDTLHACKAKAQQTKRKRPIESRQSDNVRKAARKACETGEETRKRRAQNQERMASLRQSETREQSMKRQAQNQERMASLRQSETCEQSMKRQAQNQERMASLRLHCSVSIATHQIAEWRTCANQLTPRVLHFSALVVLCVCVCVRGPHLQLAQLSDKVGILAVSVSCSLVFKKGVFRTIAFWRS